MSRQNRKIKTKNFPPVAMEAGQPVFLRHRTVLCNEFPEVGRGWLYKEKGANRSWLTPLYYWWW